MRYRSAASLVTLFVLATVTAFAAQPDLWPREEGGFLFAPTDPEGESKRTAIDPTEILFRGGYAKHPAPGLDPELRGVPQGPLVVQFPAAIRREWRFALEQQGVLIRDYVQNNAFVVEVPETGGEALLAWLDQGFLRYVGPLPVEARIDRDLLARARSAMSSEPEQITVRMMHDPSPPESVALGSLLAVEMLRNDSRPSARGFALTGDLERIAALPFVAWVEPYQDGAVQNFEGAMGTSADRVAGLGTYTGAGVRVAIDDTGIARSGTAADCGPASGSWHSDLPAFRVADDWDFVNGDTVACDDSFDKNGNPSGHGTHVAGTIGGAGISDPTHRGIAPNVTLLVYKDGNNQGSGFGNFASVLSRAASRDAQIVANSWGGGNGVYNSNAEDADDAVRGAWTGSDGLARRMLVTVSAGNDNDKVSSPASGKNVIAVGATKDGNVPNNGASCWCVNNNGAATCGATTCDSNPDVDPTCSDDFGDPKERICFSNYGFLDTDGDGYQRQKPDVVAPGTQITSTAASHLFADGRLYTTKSGTSMSQPMVAGVAALMYEKYPEFQDWPEMMKARLLGTAIPMGDRTRFGHGMVDAYHAVYDSSTMTTLRWSGRSISGTGNEVELTFDVPAGFLEVRVFMTWADPPSSSTEVVNDLDLRVYDSTGTLVGSSLYNDETVEWVRTSNGQSGTWRAVVRGENVPSPPQRYGLFAAAKLRAPSFSIAATASDSCVAPGDPVTLTTALSNDGYPVAGTRITLDLPDALNAFHLDDAEISSADPSRAKTITEPQIWRDTGFTYRAAVGEIDRSFDRSVTWHLRADAVAPNAEYVLYASADGYGASAPAVERRIRVDGSAPNAPGGLTSSTHAIGACSNRADVTMSWVTAGDPGLCGIDGYGVYWRTGSAAMPGATKDIEEVTSYSQTLSSSSDPYYFSIRSVDNAGNWGATYASSGPYFIDSVAPGSASNLGSQSHPTGSCSGDPAVTMAWSAAPDAHCGVDGYGVFWSLNQPGLPSTVKDIEEVTSYAETLPFNEAPRFFNLRTVDNAGNWAATYVSYGPITIDKLPGEIGNVRADRSGQDVVLSWDADADANVYRVYRDTRADMSTQVLRGTVPSGTTTFTDPGAAGPTEPSTYYRVVGTNVCGAEGR